MFPQWGCEGPYSGVYAAPAAVFRLSFLGSVEVEEDSRRRKKRPKKNMVEEAVTKIKVAVICSMQIFGRLENKVTQIRRDNGVYVMVVMFEILKMSDRALQTHISARHAGDLTSS